jgi:H+/Cl- antiporter ClcA
MPDLDPPDPDPTRPSALGRIRSRVAHAGRDLVHVDLGEQGRLLAHLGKWIGLGAVVGALSGLAVALFLAALDWATRTRLTHPWLLWLLPVAGLATGLVYLQIGGRASGGNNLILDEIHEPTAWVPRRMAPLIFVGTVVSVLFGASVGREGTALQMSGSITDLFARVFHVRPADRRILLISALAGGFGAVFGVPVAGCVFALEIQSVGRMRYDALVPALTASLVGDLVVRHFGVLKGAYPTLGPVTVNPALVAKVAVAGLAFGLAALVFAELIHGVRRVFESTPLWPPLRPFVGGLMIVALTYLVGSRAYLGLSVPLIDQSLAGGIGVVTFAFAFKLIFTSISLGAGFPGGEVTPLFVIGATLGVTLGRLLGVPVELMAAVGFVAVFAGAANVPITCTIMGAELFGVHAIVLFAVACVVSYVFSAHRGIYSSQRIGVAKGADLLGRFAPDIDTSLHRYGLRQHPDQSAPAQAPAEHRPDAHPEPPPEPPLDTPPEPTGGT